MSIKAIIVCILLISIAMDVAFSPINDTKGNQKTPNVAYKNLEEFYKNLHVTRGNEKFTKEEWLQNIPKFSYKNRKEFYKKLNVTRRSENSTRKTWLFKDYLMKFNPNVVFDRLKNNKNAMGKNFSIEGDFEQLFDEMDITDHLLQINIDKTIPRGGRRWNRPTTTTDPPLPRWRPPGYPVKGNRDRDLFSIRMRMFHLIQHAIYQTRNRMVVMQVFREQYKKNPLYKMGFLFARVDVGCKVFHSFAYRTLHPCFMRDQSKGVTRLEVISMLHAEERLNNKWFEIELLIDLIERNDRAAKKIIQQKINNRTNEFENIFED